MHTDDSWNPCFLTNGRYLPHVSSLKLSDYNPVFSKGENVINIQGEFGVRFVCFGVSDVKSLDKI